IPCDSKFFIVAGPNRSLPTLATMPTFAPQRRAATAWLAPLPPKPRSNFLPKIVSPGRGNTSLNVVRSTLALPTTAIRDCLAFILPLVIPSADYIRTEPGNRINSRLRGELSRRWSRCRKILRYGLDRLPGGEYKQRQSQNTEAASCPAV